MSEIMINKNTGLIGFWNKQKELHPGITQFLVFFILSAGITVLQLILMPLIKLIFEQTSLLSISFQVFQLGQNVDGSPYYIFDYGAGSLASGGGGGLGYFLAVQLAIGIAQIVNFFAQRNVTFKSNSNIWTAAFWYVLAYIVITIGAAAAQGLYKAPIYNLFINTWGWGSFGETTADVITMVINSTISFMVFYPIFKVIFKQKSSK
ncbi:hypothetical protein I6N90_16715 [Paenibacillus sp. GSMTC-2017]|uniref:hypothetical protein n=1 Tax=Paenibacillus sp. GSMTC-2017 TaxID=2794350 RepID=UPI0018D80277|nr:hypothetical protein [Paenibacillus sp. GSMTC-2017]MBH5319440.1 hypothetical protein [Paenibacillus sp. GSMTC-2017]